MGRMNDYKEMDWMKYGIALLLTIVIFGSGVLLGNYFTGQKVEQLHDVEQRIRLDTLGAELQYEILIGDPCRFVNSTPLTKNLYDLSEKLDYLENIYGEDDETVLSLKEQYSLLEVRHWLYTQKTNRQCGTNYTPILYFYSNQGDCDRCEQQGYVLTYLRKKYDNLRVYSFDINMNNAAVDTIKDIYDVDTAPTLIVGSRVYREFKTRNEMERIVS